MNNKLLEWVESDSFERKMALAISYEMYKEFYHKLQVIKEMAGHQNVPESLNSLIRVLAAETENEYLMVSDWYHDTDFDEEDDITLKTNDKKMAQILREYATELSCKADEAERNLNGGLTDEELENWCQEQEQRCFLKGQTLQQKVDKVARNLNNGYTYTQITEHIKHLLEVKYNFLSIDKYDGLSGETYSECLISELRDAGIDVDRVEDCL